MIKQEVDDKTFEGQLKSSFNNSFLAKINSLLLNFRSLICCVRLLALSFLHLGVEVK